MNKCQACNKTNDVVWSDTCKKCRDMGCDYEEWECALCHSWMSEKEYYFCDICPHCRDREPSSLDELGEEYENKFDKLGF